MVIARLILDYVEALAWPIVAVILIYSLKPHLESIVLRLKSAKIPGGISFEMSGEIEKAKELSEQVTIQNPPAGKENVPILSRSDANELALKHGLEPSPSGLNLDKYRNLAREDPNLALAGIRIELEILGRNIAKGFNVDIGSGSSIFSIYRRLHEHGAITEAQYKLINQVMRVSNAAVHGVRVSQSEANDVIEISELLAKQYTEWLSWGFLDKQ